ncbi:BGTF surface domain-containing protein [Halanaeroarchaeum sp. HSR-CO]|uniref:BGTF surface domain-containing protein n=1 Tax=Halanaeroarchaeum sp. HSR-CO TaxID=2866382 RepID=UPI00217D9BA9|nr:BGTF surface domain-containing protein [Halanaeroarchaeum sp. HSR-CO]
MSYVEGSEDGKYTEGDTIYTEKDVSGSPKTLGDRLTALTVQNRGTLSADAIESVSLHQDGSRIASTTTSHDGVWTLEPGPDEGVIPTGDAATNLSVTATLSPDAPTDATLDFEISPVEDDGLGDEFDTGDRGMFFADGSPVGGIDSGPTYAVADPAAITADATAFQNPDRDGATAVELAFTDAIDPETTTPDAFAVETVAEEPANVTEVVDDGDGRVVLVMESSVSPSAVESVSLASDELAVKSGAAVPEQTLAVESTSVTVAEADERPHVVYQGERVAVLANEGGGGENDVPNRDESVRIEADTTDDGDVDELWGLTSTGESSLLTGLDTNESNASAYRVTFQSEDGDEGETVRVPVEELSLSVTANRTNTTDVAGPIGATVSASGGDRAIRAELLEADNQTVLDSQTVTLDSEGDGVVEFEPRVANVSIRVTDLGTGVTNRTETVAVRKGYPGASFDRSVFEEERGDVAAIGIRLVDTENATVSIGSEAVNYHERIAVVDRDGNGHADLQVNTHRAGAGAPGRGIGLAGNENHSLPNDRVVDVRRTAPAAKGLSDPLETGNYTLEATVDGEVTDVALLRIVERSTAGASTLVAPAGVDLDDPEDIENWTTPRETVAVGDQAVIAVDATGIDGFLNDSTDLRRGSAAAARTGAYVDIRRANPPQNQPARGLNVSNASTLVDGERDGLYVVVPSEGGPYAIEDGEEFDAAFVLNESSPYVPGGSGSDDSEPESAETVVAFEAPDGRFTGLDENETLDLQATANATIAGETNVAPGTTVTITVRSDDDNVTFQQSDEEVVSDDGTFDGSVDLEDYQEGTEYTVVATANDDELTAVRTGSVVEEPITVAPAKDTGSSGQSAGGGGDDPEDEVTTAEPTTTSTQPTTEPDSGGSVEERAATFVTEDVPEFIRTQETNIVIVLGIVAFLYGLLGLRRLTR